MKRYLLLTLAFCIVFPSLGYAPLKKGEELYQDAHRCYEELKASGEMKKYRDQWMKCIGQFEFIAKKYSRSNAGEKARYSIGLLYEGLAENSKNGMHWNEAVEGYETFAKHYPRSKLADDAYFNSGRIRWENNKDKVGAKKNMNIVVRFYKDGDKYSEAKRYIKSIEGGIVPEREVPEYKPVAVVPRIAPAKGTPITIVIDPGHGGTDKGAVGKRGTKEKYITLDISKKLAKELKKLVPNSRIYLTRWSDKTISLSDRTKFANKKNADLFISVHANASRSSSLKGIQTYYLNNATDEAAKRLAKQENEHAGRSVSDLDTIIATMLQTATTDESKQLARDVHNNLFSSLSKKYSGVVDQHVRSALFYVLVGTKCPAILVETSYLSNPKEERRLKDKNYQDSIVKGIASGVKRFVKREKKLASL